MEFFVPVQPATFSVNPVTPSQKSADAVRHNLQPYQVVQATVAEKGEGRVLLEMDGKQMWAQSKAEVKTGQQLNLQVTTTEPRLQLRVIPQGFEQHLLRVLHLFDHKPELGARLHELGNRLNDQNAQRQLNQLAQQFLGQRQVTSGGELIRATAPLLESLTQLQQASPEVRSGIAAMLQQLSVNMAPSSSSTPAETGDTRVGMQLLQNFANTLQTASSGSINANSASSTEPVPTQIQQILNPLLQPQTGEQLTPGNLQQLQNLLLHISKSPASFTNTGTSGNIPTAGAESSHLQALTASVLQSLAQSLGNIQQQMATPPPRELALLAQILGLNFEGRLLNGEVEQARNSLKGLLLQLKGQEDSPPQVREHSTNLLQQLELFQLCRGRLAQNGVLFLPLPYDFLHQGYVLIEEHGSEQDTAGSEKEKTLSVTLNLTLEHLGSLNIHMLFVQEQLFMRISCTDARTTALIQKTHAELDAVLQPLGLKRINIDARGKDPAVALFERLSPDRSVLDAHV
jgi:Trp operon repressor